jgi:hypothetical protein
MRFRLTQKTIRIISSSRRRAPPAAPPAIAATGKLSESVDVCSGGTDDVVELELMERDGRLLVDPAKNDRVAVSDAARSFELVGDTARIVAVADKFEEENGEISFVCGAAGELGEGA